MYKAKAAGTGIYKLYEPGCSDGLDAGSLRSELREALGRKEMTLWYQPLVDLLNGSVVSMEALLRWQRPAHGILNPLLFIPEAERSGLIVPIGQWVLREACAQNARWQRAGIARFPIAVNLSARELEHEGLAENVAEILRTTGLDPRYLELEITETAIMRDIPKTAAILDKLKLLGVRIVIDDFGTGYSSLQRIKLLPVDVIKIDRSFIEQITVDRRDAAIVAAVVGLAQSLGIDIVAEGVETQAQVDFLRSLPWGSSDESRCNRLQGFLFSRPVPAAEATRLLEGNPALLADSALCERPLSGGTVQNPVG